MRVLVTGGGGFLGRHIIGLLRPQGWELRSLGRSPQPALTALGVAHIAGALHDPAAARAAVEGCDAVIHTAAKAGVWGPAADYELANLKGTSVLLDAARAAGVSRFVHTSTPSVVFSGEAFAGADESLPYGRNWLCPYARTKAEAEQLALGAHTSSFRVCALRPHLIWGAGDPHLVPAILRAASRGLPVIGNGRNRVDMTHVRNAAQAHLLALDALDDNRAGGRAYFLSDDAPVELWPWVNRLLADLGKPPLTRRVSLRQAYAAGAVLEFLGKLTGRVEPPKITRFAAVELAKDHWFSVEAAKRDLGYSPQVDPASAWREMVDSFRDRI